MDLNAKNTPARWKIVGNNLIENHPEQLDKLNPEYRKLLEASVSKKKSTKNKKKDKSEE